jgi:outer membrane protein
VAVRFLICEPFALGFEKNKIFPHFKISFMLKVKLIICLIFSSIAFTSFAQEDLQNKKVWTLEECISYAVKYNITVRRSELTLETSRAYYDQTKAAFLPTVNAGASHYFNYGRSIDRATNQFINENTQNGGLQLNGSLPLFNGLQNQFNFQRYKYQVQADLANVEQTKYNVSMDVASYYLDILLNHELLQAANIQLQSSKEQVERTQKLVTAGALPEANLLEVKAQMSTEELNVVNAENQLALSKLYLLQGLLLPANTEFEIVVPKVEKFEILQANDPNGIFNIAVSTQPSIKSADLNIKSARYNVLSAKANRLPSLGLGAGMSTNYSSQFRDQFDLSYQKQIRENRGEYISLNLSVPIFNNFQVRSAIQVAEINRKRAELNSYEIRNSLRQGVEQAYQKAKSAEKRYYTTGNQVTSLREAFRVNEQRFNVGAINSLDYTLSKNKLNQSESDYIRSKYDYLFRLKILDFYQNKPLTLSEIK